MLRKVFIYFFLRDVWIRTQKALRSKQARYQLSHPYAKESSFRYIEVQLLDAEEAQ
jgi:hypothetical protein